METKIAVPLSIGIIVTTLTAFAFAKEKRHITMAIRGSMGAFSLIYNLLRKDVNELEMI